MYSCALLHDVGQHWAPVLLIPLPRCLSRSPSVCSGLSEDPRSPTALKAPCSLERLTGRKMCVLLFHYLQTPLSLNQHHAINCCGILPSGHSAEWKTRKENQGQAANVSPNVKTLIESSVWMCTLKCLNVFCACLDPFRDISNAAIG